MQARRHRERARPSAWAKAGTRTPRSRTSPEGVGSAPATRPGSPRPGPPRFSATSRGHARKQPCSPGQAPDPDATASPHRQDQPAPAHHASPDPRARTHRAPDQDHRVPTEPPLPERARTRRLQLRSRPPRLRCPKQESHVRYGAEDGSTPSTGPQPARPRGRLEPSRQAGSGGQRHVGRRFAVPAYLIAADAGISLVPQHLPAGMAFSLAR